MFFMKQAQGMLELANRGRGLTAFTPEVARWVAASGIAEGLLTLFIQHTSASLLIQENYDPDVQADLERFFARLVKDPLNKSNVDRVPSKTGLRKTRDAGRSRAYDAKERNAAQAGFRWNPLGTGYCGRHAVSRAACAE